MKFILDLMLMNFPPRKDALPIPMNHLAVCGSVDIDKQHSGHLSFFISLSLPGCCCFLTAHSPMCVCRVDVGVVGGTRSGAVVFYCAAIKLCSSSHQSSVQKLSVWRFDLSILCNKPRHKLFITSVLK